MTLFIYTPPRVLTEFLRSGVSGRFYVILKKYYSYLLFMYKIIHGKISLTSKGDGYVRINEDHEKK